MVKINIIISINSTRHHHLVAKSMKVNISMTLWESGGHAATGLCLHLYLYLLGRVYACHHQQGMEMHTRFEA